MQLVPVPLESACQTCYIGEHQLDIQYWIDDGLEMDSKGYIPIHQEVMKLLDSQHTLGRNDHYTMHYTSQRPPFIPNNRTIRAVTCDAIRDWYGNVLVIKADKDKHVYNITEREIGLIEYLVSRYSFSPSLMLNLIHFTVICVSAMSEGSVLVCEASEPFHSHIMLSSHTKPIPYLNCHRYRHMPWSI